LEKKESSDSESLAEDSERGEDEKKNEELLPLTCFKDLHQSSNLLFMMKEYGSYIVPLSLVGMFLSQVGNHFLYYINTFFRRKIFYPAHKVISV
jgi:hypothetical protein